MESPQETGGGWSGSIAIELESHQINDKIMHDEIEFDIGLGKPHCLGNPFNLNRNSLSLSTFRSWLEDNKLNIYSSNNLNSIAA
jgi:hypothetical protein